MAVADNTNARGLVTMRMVGNIAHVVFDRAHARNAMTWEMYESLAGICESLAQDVNVRVVQFRGAGGQAFVAGTDIEQFKAFSTGQDALDYEARINHVVGLLEALPMPTVAVIEGWAVGGGLAIATACDFRIALSGARLGVPIAKTLGNCLSMHNLARLERAFGSQRVKRMLLSAQFVDADEALACGYLEAVCDADQLDDAAGYLSERLGQLAPVTQAAMKQGLQRLINHSLPDGDDLVVRCYTSDDFHEGVTAFVEKRAPIWRGH